MHGGKFSASSVQDHARLCNIGSLKTHHQRHREANVLCCSNDGACNAVALHDAAEDIHQHALDGCIGEDDSECFGNRLLRGAAADVQEVCWVAAVQFDDVHGAHRQTSAVDEAADVAVESHKIQFKLASAHL